MLYCTQYISREGLWPSEDCRLFHNVIESFLFSRKEKSSLFFHRLCNLRFKVCIVLNTHLSFRHFHLVLISFMKIFLGWLGALMVPLDFYYSTLLDNTLKPEYWNLRWSSRISSSFKVKSKTFFLEGQIQEIF